MSIIPEAHADGITNKAIPWLNNSDPSGNLSKMLTSLFQFVLIAAGLLTFGYLIFGAVQWITSGGDKHNLESARNKMVHAIIGLIILFCTWAIMTLVFSWLGFSGLSLGGNRSGSGSNPNNPSSTYINACRCITGQCASVGTLSFDGQNTCQICTASGWTPGSGCVQGSLINGSCGPCQ